MIISLTCYAFSFEIMSWRYGTHVDMATRCFSLLILSAICHSTVHIYGTLLTSAGQLKLLNILSGVSVLISVVLNLWLAPKLLAEGSALASLSTQIFAALVHVLVVLKVFKFRPDLGLLLRFAILLLCLIFFGQVATYMPWAWGLNALVMASIGLGIAMLLRLIDIKGLREILMQSESR